MKLSNPRLRGRKVSDQCKKAVVKNYVGTCRWHVLFGHQAIIGELYMPQLPAGRFGMSLLCCGAIGKDNFNFKLTFALRLA